MTVKRERASVGSCPDRGPGDNRSGEHGHPIARRLRTQAAPGTTPPKISQAQKFELARIVRASTTIPPRHKVLFLALIDRYGEGGACFPSVQTIANESGVCHRSAVYFLQDLELNGLLFVERHGGGRGKANDHHFPHPDHLRGKTFSPFKLVPRNKKKGATIDAPFREAERVQGSTEKGATMRDKGCNVGCTPTTIQNQGNHHKGAGAPSRGADAPFDDDERKAFKGTGSKRRTSIDLLSEKIDREIAERLVPYLEAKGKRLDTSTARTLAHNLADWPDPNLAAEFLIAMGWTWFKTQAQAEHNVAVMLERYRGWRMNKVGWGGKSERDKALADKATKSWMKAIAEMDDEDERGPAR